ncbi:YadA domain-containing protein [Actinobacillus porcinus]|uniref:YadA domain-containing protein n=1 Tax=Actinobacillus porcinus TaxID=51048 RepID=A0ABY6TKI3_9PAST|nr:YadA-like family protein [Actinobacillus porcinus]VFY92615.1 YadA domain-containing protein [Actinobacillus porcinus]VTU06876.1 YadA domain-containing protein [Actinobacillus porcinus]
MNKIFKIKQNSLGQSIVTSELAKSCGKGKTLAMAILSLLSIGVVNPALATSSTIGEGNLVTGEKGVTDGYNNIVTATKGMAQGNDSIATGNNLSRDEFSAKLNQYSELLSDKTLKESEIGTIGTNIEVNSQTQKNLNDKIRDLNEIIDRSNNKNNQLDNFNNQLTNKQSELTSLIEALEQAKENAQSTSSASTRDKTVWTDFTSQLGKLDWNKLSDSSNGTSGVNKLATDLKGMIEADYPDYTDKWEIKKYEEIISGYVNRQGLFDANEDAIGTRHEQSKDYYTFNFDISGPTYTGNIFLYDTTSNKRGLGGSSLANYLENVSDVSSSEISIDVFNNLRKQTYVDMIDGKDKDAFYSFYNLKNIISSETNNAIQNIAKSYNAINYDYLGYGKGYAKRASDLTDAVSLLHLPPVAKKSSMEFIAQRDLSYFIENTFQNELGSVNNGIVSDQNTKAFISNTDVNYLREWVSLFYDNFYNNIDFTADESAWLFDKNSYLKQLSTVESFASKIKEYVAAYDSAVTNPSDTNAQIKLVTLYNDIRQNKGNGENYYENIKVELKQSTIDLFNQYAEETAKELTEDAQKLKLYDARNEVIKGIITAAQDLQNDINEAQKAIDAKQEEIDDLTQKIKDLALTPDEEAAADLKTEKEKELADKQAEKTQLEQDQVAKQLELDEINRKLAETNLENLGERSIAIGVNAFASGDDSIAMGTNSTVTSNDGIAIGRNTNVTGKQSIAIGAENTVTGDKSIAIGVGHTVSGNRSTTIGDPNTITGDDVFVAGNNNSVASNNVMVMGNNITVGTGFDGAVVLGANSTVAAANPTSSIEIQGNTYNFAGTNPASTVSVGKAGEERQITNVAAGRISKTSTDAINGSQLYAVTEALNAIQSINLDDIAAANINTQATVTAGQGITIAENDNANGTKNYTASAKIGDGLSFDENGAIRANGTTLHAGENVEITGDANGGYTINAKTQIINGGKATVVHAGDNVRVTGDVDNGFTVNVDNMRTTVTGGQGAEVTLSDNADGSKNYTVNVKVGEGLTYDDKGNLVNDMKLTAGENVQVSGDAKGGYTISATDTNTQATVSADKGITITETNNANGTKNYAVSAKLGKGLKVDENGAIAATAQPINGGAGVTITTNAQDEAVVNVTGVTTTTDDGKTYTRSDLTKSVGVKGDGKNISTSTVANGDVQVKLADDVKVNSVAIHNGPTINQQGVNANNTRITNVQDGVTPTDAVNVRQLNQQGNILNQRIDNLADNVKKNKKRNDAGIASTAAMANIPQVMLAGKSGVGVGVGHRSGQNAIAVGYSRASDNAKHIIKLSAGLDTQSKATFGAGYMYQW